jgi:hypothetical protein
MLVPLTYLVGVMDAVTIFIRASTSSMQVIASFPRCMTTFITLVIIIQGNIIQRLFKAEHCLGTELMRNLQQVQVNGRLRMVKIDGQVGTEQIMMRGKRVCISLFHFFCEFVSVSTG